MSKDIETIINEMTNEQQEAVKTMIEAAVDNIKHSNINTEDLQQLMHSAKKEGSLKSAFLAHAADYGITNIGELFTGYQNDSDSPRMLENDVAWVSSVMSGVKKLPFARVKNLVGDYTDDSLRAKGYVTSSLKTEDVFALLKRTTDPTTIYKKTKIDRDDVIDVTTLDAIVFLKKYMKSKIDEELARCILFGDGRSAASEYKVDEECIRPIINDSDLYTVKCVYDVDGSNFDSIDYNEVIENIVRDRKKYKGSGNPSLYIGENCLSEMLLVKEKDGSRVRLYKSVAELCDVLRVKEIIPVAEMDLISYSEDSDDGLSVINKKPIAIMINLVDYGVGTNRGGEISFFDDFDIDYNQQKYLAETRSSGALMVPHSAVVFSVKTTTVKAGVKTESEGELSGE